MEEKKRYTVCLVEDEILPRELYIRYILERPELDLKAIAKDGKDALEKISRETFDLLILDINLPNMSGMEIIENLDELP